MPKTALDIDEMQASAGRACDLMKVLANPDRLLILCQLSQREMCVTARTRRIAATLHGVNTLPNPAPDGVIEYPVS